MRPAKSSRAACSSRLLRIRNKAHWLCADNADRRADQLDWLGQLAAIKAAQNARRYGLSVPLSADSAYDAEAKNIAREFAGQGASSEIFELAHCFAAASLDLTQTRRVRHELFGMNFPLKEMEMLKTDASRVKEFATKLAHETA